MLIYLYIFYRLGKFRDEKISRKGTKYSTYLFMSIISMFALLIISEAARALFNLNILQDYSGIVTYVVAVNILVLVLHWHLFYNFYEEKKVEEGIALGKLSKKTGTVIVVAYIVLPFAITFIYTLLGALGYFD